MGASEKDICQSLPIASPCGEFGMGLESMNRVMIDRSWLPLNALRAFEAVAKHGSFTVAANTLLISQSALSRHVIALESC